MERELEKCRERVGEELGCGSHGYSAGTKAVVLAYARRRIGTGASVTAVSSEIGLSAVTLARWQREPRSGSGGFVPVEVGIQAAPGRGEVVVHGPRGLRVEGADVRFVAELIVALS
jgi:hypothetical protein